MIKFLDLHSQYLTIKPEIDAAISSVINSCSFIGGKTVENFEKNFAAYQQAGNCVGVANGTDALEIAIEALDLPKGSEIIVPANTFIATSEAVTRTGHRVVFADIDPATYTIDINDASKRISPATSAIMAVHLYGHPCDMDVLTAFAKKHNLKIIEDCAQAHGAEYKGKRVGSFGNAGTFSFYPGKNLGAYGDGGAIVTNDDSLAHKCRTIANHGRISKYDHCLEGRNSRLDGLQAAILDVKLKHLDSWINRRNNIARLYMQELKDITDLVLPEISPQIRHSFHLFVIRTNRRDKLQKFLLDAGIETGIHYPIALPKLSAYSYLNQETAAFKACALDSQLLSLPMGEHLTDEEVNVVVGAVRGFMSSVSRRRGTACRAPTA